MMVGLLSCEEIETLLQRQRVGRIGCIVDDRPYVVPMRYVYDGAAVYVASGPGQKIDAMRACPRVCFEIDEIDAAGVWRSVVASGHFTEVSDEEERRAALGWLGVSWGEDETEGASPPDNLIVFCIPLFEKSGRFGRTEDAPAAHTRSPVPASRRSSVSAAGFNLIPATA
jgi:nitroimidazol reductase NimA-like FMN-containing flavoprotein (pyridoxamine 5'-phosphate oxidase superfamily)